MGAGAATRYVDERRTHEVRAWFERGAVVDFVTEERAFGSEARDEAYRERRVVREPWETRLHVMALETRLALLGGYQRSDGGAWTPVRVAQGAQDVDLAPLALDGSPGSLEFHHFEKQDRRVTLVGVRQEGAKGPRWLLARFAYAFPAIDKGDVRVVHATLAPPVYRSATASQQLELRDLGYRKLPTQARMLLTTAAWKTLRGVLDDALSILVERGIVHLRNDRGAALDANAVAALEDAMRASANAASRARSYDLDDEIAPAMAAVAGKKPAVLMDQANPDVMAALRSPRLEALHARLLAPGDEQRMIEAGERAIHHAMRAMRDRMRPDEWHLVSVLEASLVLRHALAKRVRVDPEIITRVKHADAYL